VKRVSVAAAQGRPGAIDLDELDRQLEKTPAQLVVLPELANGPYFPLEPRSGDPPRGERLDGAFLAAVGELAARHSAHLLVGLHLADTEGAWNAAVLVGPDGAVIPGHEPGGQERIAYRKRQLCDITTRASDFRESEYFSAGSEAVVWDLPFGRLGCLICYDRHFPEAWRALRRADVEIVGVPVASSAASRAWFVPEMQAMALQQNVYAVVANRAGTEQLGRGTVTEYGGLSCIVAPDGSVLAEAPFGEPNRLVGAELDPDLLTRARREHRFIDDLRDELYAARSPQ
jgi:predicted amidohydrolase